MSCSRSFMSVILALLATPVLAAGPTCTGRNVLDDIRLADPRAHAAIRAAADATPNANALLWKIEHPNQPQRPPSYLFGTIHLADARVLALSPATERALGAVRRIALEVDDLSPARVGAAMAGVNDLILLPDNRRLNQYLTEPELRKTQGILIEAGLPGEITSRVQPWVAQMLLAVTACERKRIADGNLPLDAALQRRAEADGISVVGLETIEMQFQSLAAVPEADQVALLKSGLKLHDRAGDMMETLVQLYLKRDLGAIWPLQLAIAAQSGTAPGAFDAFEKHLLTSRNARMRNRAIGHLAQGGVFIAVGALHLPGKAGLVELFRDAGYTLSPIE